MEEVRDRWGTHFVIVRTRVGNKQEWWIGQSYVALREDDGMPDCDSFDVIYANTELGVFNQYPAGADACRAAENFLVRSDLKPNLRWFHAEDLVDYFIQLITLNKDKAITKHDRTLILPELNSQSFSCP